MAEINWGIIQGNPIDQQAKAYSYADQIGQNAAKYQAGQQYAAGDYSGASRTQAQAGNIDQAQAIQQQGTKSAEAVHAYITQALPVFQKIMQTHAGDPDGGKQAIGQAFDSIAPEISQLTGHNDQAIAQIRQNLVNDPAGTLQRIQAMVPQSYKTVGAGDTLVSQQGNNVTPVYTAAPKPTAPTVHTFTEGDKTVERQFDQATGQWKEVSSGPRYKPPGPVSENFAAPTMIGFTGSDGEEVQRAAIFDKRTGRYLDATTQQPFGVTPNLRVIGNATGGARSQQMVGRILTNAEDATSGIENLVNVSSKATNGLFNNLETAPLSALGRAVSPQEVQDFQATNVGLGRAMATLATGGLAVDQETLKRFDGLNLNMGDTYITKMRKLAELKQQSTNALDVQLHSPTLTNDQKKVAQSLRDRINTAIPWTVGDVQKLENSSNPSESLRDASMGKLHKNGDPKTDSLLKKYGL